jgi:hypothetical protein
MKNMVMAIISVNTPLPPNSLLESGYAPSMVMIR